VVQVGVEPEGPKRAGILVEGPHGVVAGGEAVAVVIAVGAMHRDVACVVGRHTAVVLAVVVTIVVFAAAVGVRAVVAVARVVVDGRGVGVRVVGVVAALVAVAAGVTCLRPEIRSFYENLFYVLE